METLGAEATRQRIADNRLDGSDAVAFAFVDEARHVAYDWHAHTGHQLLYALRGVVHLETRERRFLLPPQRAAWIPAGLSHRTAIDDVESCSVFFRADLPECPEGVGLRILAASPLMREMIGFATRWPPGAPSDPLAESYFRTLALLCRDWTEAEMPFHLPVARSPALARAMEYAQFHLAEADIAGAADTAALSVRTLRRRFADEVGMSWKDYLHHSRLLGAMARLGDPAISIAEVAEEVGFASLSAFSKAFAQIAGESPGRYRRRLCQAARIGPDPCKPSFAGRVPSPVTSGRD